MSRHVCYSTGCKRHIPRRFLLCKTHFRQLPEDQQSAIAEWWREAIQASPRGVPSDEVREALQSKTGWSLG